MTKHTKIYKERRAFYCFSIWFIVVVGMVTPFLVRNMVNCKTDFWTFYDGILLVWAITQCVHLYIKSWQDFMEVSHKERDPKWKQARRRYEYLIEKKEMTHEEVKELLSTPLDVLF